MAIPRANPFFSGKLLAIIIVTGIKPTEFIPIAVIIPIVKYNCFISFVKAEDANPKKLLMLLL